MQKITSYNLITEPFIYYAGNDGATGKMGILDIFKNAPSIARIGGDSEIQELPLMRMLLAIMYRALEDIDDGEDWLKLWEHGIPINDIEKYLKHNWRKFDLLDGEQPFYQISEAEYVKEDKVPSNLELLLDHQALGNGSGRFLFSSYKPSGYGALPFDTAARKLIELQSYNTGSRKSTLKGDTRKKKYSYAQVGWLGNFSALMLKGENLAETLLLNFVPYGVLGVDRSTDKPVWEREPQTAKADGVSGPMDESRRPEGPADLYTHQISRVKLNHNGAEVISSHVGIGDRIFKTQIDERIEPMALWREIPAKGNKEPFTSPTSFNSVYSWQMVNGLFGYRGQKKIALFDWYDQVLELLGDEEIDNSLPDRTDVIVFRSEYGTQDAIIKSQTVSVMSLPRDVIKGFSNADDEPSETGSALAKALEAAEISEKTAKFVQILIADLLIASGKKPGGKKGTTPMDFAKPKMEEFYYELSHRYQAWLVTVNDDNYREKYEDWIRELLKFSHSYASKAVETSSRSALAGRKIPGEDKFMSSYTALNKFEVTIYKNIKTPDSRKDKE